MKNYSQRMIRLGQAGVKAGLVWWIDFYRQWVSPLVGRHCRFYPTCSSYAREAIIQKGCLKGIGFSIKRILKCHPFHPGGFDPL